MINFPYSAPFGFSEALASFSSQTFVFYRGTEILESLNSFLIKKTDKFSIDYVTYMKG